MQGRPWLQRLAGLWLLLLGAIIVSPPIPAVAATSSPTEVVRNFYSVLLDLMQHAAALGPKGRYQKLEPVVRGTFDVPFMARLSIGPTWARLTPEQKRRAGKPPVLLILPGSRRSEIKHHMTAFGMTLTRLQEEGIAFEAVLPTMPHLTDAIRAALKYWKVQPRIVIGEEEKRGFRSLW